MTHWGSTQGITYRRWSVGAIECYKRNCICKGCPTFDLIGKQCRMKQSVLSLVKNVGTPDTDPKQSIINDENIKNTPLPLGEGAVAGEFMSRANAGEGKHRKGKIEITKHVGKQKDAGSNSLHQNEREIKTMHDNDLNLDYPNYCAKLIDAVKKGYENYDDLEKASETSKHNISVYFDNLYKAFLKNGLIQQSGKSHKQAVIDFIQSRLCDADYRQNEQPAQIHEQNTTIHEQNTTIHEQNTDRKSVV